MNNGYTIIPDSFLDLDLDLTEIAILSVIYGFSQDGDSTFKGSWRYLQSKAKCGRTKVFKSLLKLTDMGLIQKIDLDIHGVKFTEYKASAKCMGSAFGELVSPQSEHNNIDDNIDINNLSLNNKPSRFVKPTKEEIEAYCREKGYTHVNAEAFISHYDSNGWMVGKNKMSLWRSAVSGWEIREVEREQKIPSYNRPQAQPRKSVLQHNREVAERLFARRKEAMADEQ